jgi:hypothetical protein
MRRDRTASSHVTRLATHAELLLAFWTAIGFKLGDFMTTGTNEKQTAWLLPRFRQSDASLVAHAALNCSEPPHRNPSWPR